ncbi:HypC/HybG/HupF family hydrogenase formation chaperone [Streptomyces acidiscabies]|uniref:HypC/HybG/HupF family hydrogenase formation chaperone n=1 Tax=Streptomyces acidiscabies TaxID=42234 RepID=UPI000A4B827D
MCLGIPGRVLEIHDDAGLRMATVDFGGVRREACLSCVPEADVGSYVVVHVGFAITLVDEAEAHRTLDVLRAMAGAVEGELGEELPPRPCRHIPVVRPEGGPGGVMGAPPCSSEAENSGERAAARRRRASTRSVGNRRQRRWGSPLLAELGGARGRRLPAGGNVTTGPRSARPAPQGRSAPAPGARRGRRLAAQEHGTIPTTKPDDERCGPS